jgi:twitching motility protein PilT
MTGRVRDMIVDPNQTGQLGEAISSGAYYGMQTFDQALFHHVKAGRVTTEAAMRVASSPHDFKLLLQAEGRKGTTMEDVAQAQAQREGTTAPHAPSPATPSTPSPTTPAPSPTTPAPSPTTSPAPSPSTPPAPPPSTPAAVG